MFRSRDQIEQEKEENSRKVHCRSWCRSCGLCETCMTPHMDGRGCRENPVMAVIQDAPTIQDDRQEKPFTGPNWQTLKIVLRDTLGLLIDQQCYLTSALKCRPLDNEVKSKTVKLCSQQLKDELAAVRPQVILAMGAGALEALTGRKSILKERGLARKVTLNATDGTRFSCPVMPTLSVDYVLKNQDSLEFVLRDAEKALEIAQAGGEIPGLPEVDYRVVRTKEDARDLMAEIRKAKRVAWDTETSGLEPFAKGAYIVCVTVSTKPGTGWLIPFTHSEANDETQVPLHYFERENLVRWILETGPAKPLVGHNVKFDMVWVRAILGVNARQPLVDTMVASHMLFEGQTQVTGNGLKALAEKYTNMPGYERPFLTAYPDAYEKMGYVPLCSTSEDPWESLLYYAVGDVDATLQVLDALWPEIRSQGMQEVMELEMRKLCLLAEMEFHGAEVDWDLVGSLSGELKEDANNILYRLHEWPQVTASGVKGVFNPNSPPQVARLCTDQLGFVAMKTTKAGNASVDADTLTEWAVSSPEGSPASQILTDLIRYRKLVKLDGTYVGGLEEHRAGDDRVHTKFNQAVAKTFRLSSEGPNLQNLPKKSEAFKEAEKVKRLYIPGFPGGFVIRADYSQVELRTAALMSQDPAMISEYRKKDNDLHRLAASKVFGKDPADVTDEERSRAKMLNFGIVYGISAESIAARFAITVDAARQLLESFFAGFPGLRLWIEQTQEQVLRKGYVESLFGHRRHFPELKYAGKSMRQSTLRKAVNFPIQCTASNMAIYAEAFLSDVLREDGLKSYCFGQVHDEAWITGPIEELDQVARLTRDVCENLPFVWLNGEHPDYPETVPMTVDVKWGANLCDVQKYAF